MRSPHPWGVAGTGSAHAGRGCLNIYYAADPYFEKHRGGSFSGFSAAGGSSEGTPICGGHAQDGAVLRATGTWLKAFAQGEC